ncbi:conserved hypothetical protein [Neospora caninum Liverpool]|uniref:Toxoplasma gondii family D protein n=1 Tax=Neospora caninum (strain Liverpool) TaxID=572307 RepID=F0VHZ7_NEOCL|nr:conserved hypothetical protein [Neospora caninum Liverpool]CBZ53358.1 conserved hypothetical protein [Neospora caninum Liverpool]CEL67344.1 TPA: hypothetical protein BN1204_031450 [Neospora caninum Liverpool]|eukprot:XP_003883390.1 conserved hypothetical protein [Neospora caninum Liverpool]
MISSFVATATSLFLLLSPVASLCSSEQGVAATLLSRPALRANNTLDVQFPSVGFPSGHVPVATLPMTRALKEQGNVMCAPTVVEAHGVCKRLRPVQKPYPCKKQVVDKICEAVPTTIQKMCTKTVHEKKPFRCERIEYKSECMQTVEKVRDKCVQTVIKSETYPCPKVDYATQCSSRPVLVPSVCKREVQKEFQYPCEKIVSEEQCSDTEVRVDQICEEEVIVQEKYDCSKTVYVKKCEPAASPRLTSLSEEMPSDASERSNDGEEGRRRLRLKNVDKGDTLVLPMPATEAHLSFEICTDVPHVKRKTCTRDVVKKNRTPCAMTKKVPKCSIEVKTIQQTCTTMKKVVEPYACTKTEIKEECSTVKKDIEDTCSRDVPVEEKGPCEIDIFKNECVPVQVRIPDVCFEARPKTEVYDCSEKVVKSVCREELKEVNEQCMQTEYTEVEYECTHKEHVDKCLPVDVPAKSQKFSAYSPPKKEELYMSVRPSPAESVIKDSTLRRKKMLLKEKLHTLGDPDLTDDGKGQGETNADEELPSALESGEAG